MAVSKIILNFTTMIQKIVDFTFGVHSVALAIAQMLNRTDFFDHQLYYLKPELKERIEIKTYPYYNGREAHMCLQVATNFMAKKSLLISFGECRNSDSITIDAWVAKTPYDHSAIKLTDKAYEERKYLSYNKHSEAVDHIQKLIYDYLIDELLKEKKIKEEQLEVDGAGRRCMIDPKKKTEEA